MRIVTSGVYLIRNRESQKAYIGSSTNIEQRFKAHMSCLQNRSHANWDMQADYVEDVFELVVLEECTIDVAREREAYHIRHWEGEVYNIIGRRSPLTGSQEQEIDEAKYPGLKVRKRKIMCL